MSTLSPRSVALLRRWGAPPEAAGGVPFRRMQVWEARGPGCIAFEAEAGAGPLGLVAENAALVDGLRAGLGCELVPAGVTGLRRDEHSAMELDLEGGGVLRARLVVGADGGRSRVRTMAGIRTAGWGYGQRGVVATVATAGPPNEAAWQRFLPTGPLALLPVRDGYSNVVWSTTPAHARELEAMGRAEFGAAVTEALHGPGGGWGGGSTLPLPSAGRDYLVPPKVEGVVEGQRALSFPLHLQHALQYHNPRVALIGDAAHSVHPLAGQGVNLGFADAEALADVLAEAIESGADVGDPNILREYQRRRMPQNLGMTALLDTLKRVFAWDSRALVLARNAGVESLNLLGPLKRRAMQYALGSGDPAWHDPPDERHGGGGP